MLCIGSWVKKPTLEEEKLSIKTRVYNAFYIVDVRFDALFVNAHCFVLRFVKLYIFYISWHSTIYKF